MPEVPVAPLVRVEQRDRRAAGLPEHWAEEVEAAVVPAVWGVTEVWAVMVARVALVVPAVMERPAW
jgi:hypothetical protein